MNSTYKAECRSIQLGNIILSVYRMPDGDYSTSQVEVARVIKKVENSVIYFKRSQRARELWSSSLQSQSLPVKEFKKPIAPVPLEFAALYWQHWDAKGNMYARALVNALLKRSLRDLADEVFAEKTTAAERNAELKNDLSSVGVDRVIAMQAQLEREVGEVGDDPRFNGQLLLQMQQLVLQVELNRLLADTSFGINSGYWHFGKAIAPLLPIEYYPTVKALLIERQGRKLEFEG